MKQLTKAEEEIMQALWQLKKANVKSIIEILPEPKPAYNTVSTIVRILESKGFVNYEKQGKGDNYFQGSFKSMVSFFVKKNEVDIKDIETLLNEIDKNK